jgi:hypothetical protein
VREAAHGEDEGDGVSEVAFHGMWRVDDLETEEPDDDEHHGGESEGGGEGGFGGGVHGREW